MFCRHCGRQLKGDENFCPSCGTANVTDTADTADTAESYGLRYDFGNENPMDEIRRSELSGQVLKWGILSLAFAESGILALLGFIFSFVAAGKARRFRREFGAPDGRCRTGYILSRVGFGLGLGLTIFFTLYFLMIALVFIVAIFG